MREEDDPPKRQGTVRRTYMPPTLVEYGNIAKLTHTAFGSGADGGMMGNMMGTRGMMMCL